jgi:hypothetical protein
MKGAFLVGGTVGGGYVGTAPPRVRVGRPVGPESSSVLAMLPALLGDVVFEDVGVGVDVDVGLLVVVVVSDLLLLLLALLFWARMGVARTATAASVERRLEARMVGCRGIIYQDRYV